jgi:FkbM family methyltransferase
MVYLKQEEEADLQALPRLLRFGDTFVDCGANVGLWSLVAASLVGRTGMVHAFEPNPATFEKLTQNVERVDHLETNVKLHQAAVGSAKGYADFLPLHEHNISSIVYQAVRGTIRVPVTTLNQTLSGKRVDGIKIDVEGYELQVLRGGEELLERWKPWLCVEFNTDIARVRSLRDWNVHQFLRTKGYRPRLFGCGVRGNRPYLADSWETKGYVNLLYCYQRPKT